MFWNKNGDRLAVHTERYQKKNVKSSGGVEDVKYSVGSLRILLQSYTSGVNYLM